MKDDWCRKVANDHIMEFFRGNDCGEKSCLEISGMGWGKAGFKTYLHTRYPDVDVMNFRLPERYDFVVADQVFEHIAEPRRGLENCYYHLKPGGYFVISVPFLMKVHGAPDDYNRWTENGLRQQLIASGFEDARIETHSWGNRACVIANFDSWAPYDPETCSLENEPRFPIMVWAYARR